MFRKYILLACVLLLGPWSSFAQEYEGVSYDELVGEYEDVTSTPSTVRYSAGFSSAEFNNTAYDLQGGIYLPSIQFTEPGSWFMGLDVPFLQGSNNGVGSQELGNPQIRSQFNVYQMSNAFALWIPFSVRVGQRGVNYKLASHHDTYRSGMEIEYRNGRVSSTFGGGYQFRTLEEDKRMDVGDMVDFKTSLRVAISKVIALRGSFEWYRVFPTKYNRVELGPTVDWAAASPGMSFELAKNLSLLTEVTFPVLQSATPYQTDIAFAEVYYPQTSNVTWSWGLGANF